MRSSEESRSRARALAISCIVGAVVASCAASDPIRIGGAGGAGGDASTVGVTVDEGATDGVGGGIGDGVGGGIGSGGGGGADACGNGHIDTGEECDDGNAVPGDGCSSCVIDCELTATKNPANGHCYAVFVASGNEAVSEAACEAWGGQVGLGHLVSIGDAAEQTFVMGLVTQDGWIGGGDATTEGVYDWYDGTPFVFHQWAPGEPNDPAHQENCIYMHANGDWDDHDCALLQPSYICERRGAGTF